MQIRCNFPDISYLSETQKNNFQFLINKQNNEKRLKKKNKWNRTRFEPTSFEC